MRIPTQKEFDMILLPLTNFKYKVEHNPSDKEFIKLANFYEKTLKDYQWKFSHGNFLTSSIENDKAITYKINIKEYYNDDNCRFFYRGNYSTERICIRTTIDTPLIEYHDFKEPLLNKGIVTHYSLFCVK